MVAKVHKFCQVCLGEYSDDEAILFAQGDIIIVTSMDDCDTLTEALADEVPAAADDVQTAIDNVGAAFRQGHEAIQRFGFNSPEADAARVLERQAVEALEAAPPAVVRISC